MSVMINEEREFPVGLIIKILIAVLLVAGLSVGGWFAFNHFTSRDSKPAVANIIPNIGKSSTKNNENSAIRELLSNNVTYEGEWFSSEAISVDVLMPGEIVKNDFNSEVVSVGYFSSDKKSIKDIYGFKCYIDEASTDLYSLMGEYTSVYSNEVAADLATILKMGKPVFSYEANVIGRGTKDILCIDGTVVLNYVEKGEEKNEEITPHLYEVDATIYAYEQSGHIVMVWAAWDHVYINGRETAKAKLNEMVDTIWSSDHYRVKEVSQDIDE